MIDVEVKFKDEFPVQATSEEAFALVADVRRSGLHFPGVDELVPVDDQGRWHWQMLEKGLGPVKIRASYEAIYQVNPQGLRVQWAPPPEGGGDMESSGFWQIHSNERGTRMQFEATTLAHIPAPRLLGKMVEAFAREELLGLKRQYVRAIARTLGSSAPGN